MRTPNTRGWDGLLIMAAALLMAGAALLLLLPGGDDPNDVVRREPTVAPTQTTSPTETPLPTATPSPAATPTLGQSPTALPTAEPAIVATSVAMDVETGNPTGGGLAREADPFTVNPNAPRTQVIQYEVQRGDSVYDIAQRFGLQLETIIWSNGSFYVNALRPGLVLNILPVDGALHKVEEPVTVAALAETYQVEPQSIINSEFNNLRDATADSVLPTGLEVVIEGGTGSKEPIYWDPRGGAGTTVNPSNSTGSVYQGTARFGVGQPGSCGVQEIYDGTIPALGPVSGYVTTQDFTWNHRGIDLSAGEGSPVRAVGAGTVIFAGWSDWGYGYTIVVAHGPVMTLYAHLNGAGIVWCGQHVDAGQYIGNVGSTGRSSGPHLHFEVRDSNGVPQDPRSYLGFAPCSGRWCISD